MSKIPYKELFINWIRKTEEQDPKHISCLRYVMVEMNIAKSLEEVESMIRYNDLYNKQ